MSLRRCCDCDIRISTSATKCPHCGSDDPHREKEMEQESERKLEKIKREELSITSILCDAIQKNHIDIVKSLISQGVDFNRTKDGLYPLMFATGCGHTELVELLISQGADINAKDKLHNATALFLASSLGYKDIVQLLISKGADINAKNENGVAPLDVASEKGHDDIVQLLISKGAKSGKGGCFIATACYNSYNSPEVITLRRFRDKQLLNSYLGRLLVYIYYKTSPPIAEFIRKKPLLKSLIKKYFIHPLIQLLPK